MCPLKKPFGNKVVYVLAYKMPATLATTPAANKRTDDTLVAGVPCTTEQVLYSKCPECFIVGSPPDEQANLNFCHNSPTLKKNTRGGEIT